MDALRAGMQAVGRNPQTVAAYIAVSIMAAYLTGGLDALFLTGPLEDAPDRVKGLAQVIKLIGAAALYAAMNAIVFSILGADIDRPLWRYHGWPDALRRFFTPWFLLALTYVVLFRFIPLLGIDHPVSQLFLMLSCIVFTAHLPVGVAVMQQGRFEWRYLVDAVTPLLIQLPRMAIPLFMALFLFFFGFFSGENTRPGTDGSWQWLWGAALFEVVSGLFMCTIVCTTWCTLILHRDEADDDFDL